MLPKADMPSLPDYKREKRRAFLAMTTYYVEVFARSREDWRAAFDEAISRELMNVGAQRDVTVEIADARVNSEPTVGVYLACPAAVDDIERLDALSDSLRSGRVVLPVVEDLASYGHAVPPMLRPLNGYEWSGADPAGGLARKVLAELGVEDRRRRAFISHRREDGLACAEQVYDHLSHMGFESFIDRFHVPIGRDIQAEIADALEDCALLVLLETPLAHESEWVFDEVDYALSHQLGLLVVSWPNSPLEVPGSGGLLRHRLEPSDLAQLRGFDVMTEVAITRVGYAVEEEYVRSMVRRRRYLLRSTEEAALAAGLTCTPLPQWRLLVEGADSASLLQVSPRLPTVDDLCSLDEACTQMGNPPEGLLVHAARAISPSRKRLLKWAAADRTLTLLPENAVGGYWMPYES
jgi:hypothetical protein